MELEINIKYNCVDQKKEKYDNVYNDVKRVTFYDAYLLVGNGVEIEVFIFSANRLYILKIYLKLYLKLLEP